MANYTSKKDGKIPTTSRAPKPTPPIGAHAALPPVPTAPRNTALIGVYAPSRVAKRGLVIAGNVYDSQDLRNLAKTIGGPIFVRTDGTPHTVLARGTSSWIRVPCVRSLDGTRALH